MEVVKEQEQILGLSFNNKETITMSTHEFVLLTQFYEQFGIPLAIAKNLTDKAVADGIAKPYTINDLKKDGNGNPTRELVADFWKPKDNSLSLEDVTKKETSN